MAIVHILSDTPSIVDNYLIQLRDRTKNNVSELFRENLRRVGRVIGYEISKSLSYRHDEIETPLQSMVHRLLDDEVVVITILRAGLPLHEGLLSAMPKAENGFISAYRKHDKDGNFKIEVGYVACPNLEGKVLILNDPMLATGSSFITALEVLRKYGKPKSIHIAAVVSSEPGITNLRNYVSSNTHIWTAALDPELDGNSYILPGLGDAGDLSFGEKLQA